MNRWAEGLQIAVRPLVTLALTAGLIFGFVRHTVDDTTYVQVVTVVITFWFAQRTPSGSPPPTPPPDGGPKP